MLKVLNHPIRQRIIELLGSRGPMAWKELSSELGIGTGALYYHIDTLEGVVGRDVNKKYALSRPGKAIFDYLQENSLATSSKPIPLPRLEYAAGRRILSTLFWPRAAVYRLTSGPRLALASLVGFSVLTLAVSFYIGANLELYYPAKGLGLAAGALSYLGTLGAFVAVGYGVTRSLFGGVASPLPLAASSAFSFLPVVIFTLSVYLLQSVADIAIGRTPLTVLLVVSQGWSASLLGAGISVSSGVRIEKSILVSLVVLYSTLAIMFLSGATL